MRETAITSLQLTSLKSNRIRIESAWLKFFRHGMDRDRFLSGDSDTIINQLKNLKTISKNTQQQQKSVRHLMICDFGRRIHEGIENESKSSRTFENPLINPRKYTETFLFFFFCIEKDFRSYPAERKTKVQWTAINYSVVKG